MTAVDLLFVNNYLTDLNGLAMGFIYMPMTITKSMENDDIVQKLQSISIYVQNLMASAKFSQCLLYGIFPYPIRPSQSLTTDFGYRHS